MAPPPASRASPLVVEHGRSRTRRRHDLPGRARRRRPGRHPLYVGHDGAAQGRRHPPPQRGAHPRGTQPQLLGAVLAARQPPVHLRRHRVHLQPHAARAVRACTSRASTPGGGSRSSTSSGPSSCSWCRRWPSSSWLAPPLRRRRAVVHRHLRHRQRAPGPRHAAGPAGAHARGVGVQQLRHDRGRARLLLDAQGRVAQAASARWASPCRRSRCASSTRTAATSPPGEVGEAILRMKGREREYYRNAEATAGTWQRRLALQRRPGPARRGRLPLHRGQEEGRHHPGRQQHPRRRRRSGAARAPRRGGGGRGGRPPRRAGRGRRRRGGARPGSSTTTEELREHCAAALADYKVPRRIEFIDELPRNATGKVLKAQLQDRLATTPRSTTPR